MIVREVNREEKEQFDRVVNHPLQSWAWGEFRKLTGIKVTRLGIFEGQNLLSGYQLTIHNLPYLPYTVVYFPNGPVPDKTMLDALTKLCFSEKAIMVKMEPNVSHLYGSNPEINKEAENFLQSAGCVKGKPLSTRFTFMLDLTKSEEQLLEEMKPKTRYNLHLSGRNNVKVGEDNSPQAFEEFLKLMKETTGRQKFYAHNEDYLRKMWSVMSQAGIAHLLTAKYEGKVLVAWILFVFKNTLYYPYGASTRENRDVMASYSMMWEAINFGKKNGCTAFDLWGTPGPNPSFTNPWLGFHHFKEGFGAKLYESIGTWDLVTNQPVYKMYNLADNFRWKLLRLRKSLPF